MSSVIQQPPVVTTTVTDTYNSGVRRSGVGMVSTPFVQPGMVKTTVTEEIVEQVKSNVMQVNPQQTFAAPMMSQTGGVFMPTPGYMQPYGYWGRFNNCCPRICGLPWWIPLILGLLALGGLITGLSYGYKALSEGRNKGQTGSDDASSSNN
jgi:hypothetical protein